MLPTLSLKIYMVIVIISFLYQILLKYFQKKYLLAFLNTGSIVLIYFSNEQNYFFHVIHFFLLFLMCRVLQNFKERLILPVMAILLAFSPILLLKFSVFSIPRLDKTFISVLAISFYTFRAVSVVMDILYGRIKEKISFVNLFNFTMFFTCLYSGPLDRYGRFVADIDNNNITDWETRYNAIFRIVCGLFKKIVLADFLWNFSNDFYNIAELHHLPFWKIAVGQIGLYFKIYFNFSGYSDIAIGVSALLGIRTPENFNHPWKARNLQVFWNSWHITFMDWLKDYIFFPLQYMLLKLGLKNSTVINILSYFLLFIIAGFLHGEQLHFFYYGLFHASGFVLFFIYKRLLEQNLSIDQMHFYMNNTVIKISAITITFSFVLLSLFFYINKQVIFSIIFERMAGQ